MLERLVEGYAAAADPVRAAAMGTYMREQFPFLGIPSPLRRTLSRAVLAGLPRPDEDDLREVALACWDLPEREYRYFALDWLSRYASLAPAGFLVTARFLITTDPWWDTVDGLASNVVGTIVSNHPATVSTMDSWLAEDDLWLIRTALLHQLTYKDRTDAERLFRYCVARAGHRDFFIRKAIGWALRQYAWTEPELVRRFVLEHRALLSPLSVREALKNVE